MITINQKAGDPMGYEQLTVSTSSIGLASLPPSYTSVLIISEDDNIRWRDDGVAPTSTVGNPLLNGEAMQLHGVKTIKQFRAIRSGVSDVKLNVNYYVQG